MTEREKFRAMVKQVDENAQRLAELGAELRALGDVEILISLDAIRADIEAIAMVEVHPILHVGFWA